MAQTQASASGKYAQEKPASCNFCYFWQGKLYGCGLRNCYYLLPEEDPQSTETACYQNCSYGKHSPCIGYCLVKVMQELKVGRYAE